MANLKGLESVVSQLRLERTGLVNQLRHVDAALSVLGKLDNGRSYTKPRRRSLSVAARRKIAAAQRARWAKVKGKSKAATPNEPCRHRPVARSQPHSVQGG